MLVDALEYYENIAEEYDGETKSPLMLAEDIVLFDFLREEESVSYTHLTLPTILLV